MGLWTIQLLLFIWAVTAVPYLSPYKFELIFKTDTKPESGSIILTCRDSWTADELNVDEVSFWLNRSSNGDNATDLRERKDLVTEVIGCCSIKYSLLPNLEGNYTCGKVDDDGNVQESQQLTLISLQTVIQLPDVVQTTFGATLNGSAVLDCPIQPGALLQYYSVSWTRNGATLAQLQGSSKDVLRMDSRYDINRSTLSLMISSITVNDSSDDYQCEMYVRNPLTSDNSRLMPSHEVSLTLTVFVIPIITSGPNNVTVTNQTETPSFTCVAAGVPAPTVTWTHMNSSGIERTLTDGYEHQIESGTVMKEDGGYVTKSTVTFLNVTEQDSGVVSCSSGPLGNDVSTAMLTVIDLTI